MNFNKQVTAIEFELPILGLLLRGLRDLRG